MKASKVIFKTFKIIVGILLGLLCSFATIVTLEILLPDPNPFRRDGLNLWLTAPIITGWLFLFLWILFRKPTSQSKNIQTNGINDLPPSVSDLIDAIIDSMRYRKNERADVRQELCDHFTDALSDCENEQEKTETIKEMLAEFGDIELLGKLIRRGKKRCQPLWRKVLTHTPHAVGITILLLIVYTGWFFTGKPDINTDYLAIWNQRVRPTVDESQNAAPFYQQAADIYSEDAMDAWMKTHEEAFDEEPRSLTKLAADEREHLNQWILANEKPLNLIKQGIQKPYYWRTYATGEGNSNELIAILLPNFTEYMGLARILCWQSLIQAEQENFQDAFDLSFQSYIFGSHNRGKHSTLIEQLVAMRIQQTATKTVRIILHEYSQTIDPETLNQIHQRFEQRMTNENFMSDFSGEKLFMYDEAQRCFTESRFGKSHLYLPRLSAIGDDEHIYHQDRLIENAVSILFTHPDKEETLKAIDAFYAGMETFVKQTPATLHANGDPINKLIEELMQDNLFLETMLPALGRVIELSYRNECNSKATLTILAIIQYHKLHNQYPDSLQTLAGAGLLNKIPIDPYSDNPLVYRKTDDSFILYSLSENFTDDGGTSYRDKKGNIRTWADTGDAVFWPINGNADVSSASNGNQ
jgi:hypothetical protein